MLSVSSGMEEAVVGKLQRRVVFVLLGNVQKLFLALLEV